MKLFNITFPIILMIALASCAKKADVWERKEVNEVKMLSFGFYEADNPDVLSRDYIFSNLNTNNILVQMPANVDRSALIARFTLSDNDVIRVGETPQKSGETANDFRVPVDYFLSDGNYNAKYTVTIAKGSDFIWKAIPFDVNDSTSSMIMKVNPVTGYPYIMYYQLRSPSSSGKGAMAFIENGEWVNTEFSDGRITTNFDFTFNSAGVPYVGFSDYTATVPQAHTVKKLDGGAWSLVGDHGITPVKISYNSIAFANDAKLMLFSTYDAIGGGFARRELGISTFENNIWNVGSKMPGRASTLFSYLLNARNKNGAVYLGVYNAVSPNTISIYKYANDTWTSLLDLWRDPNSTGINISDFDIEVDEDGNVYAAFADNSNASTYKYRVIKYNPTTQAVTPVGSYIPAGSEYNFDLALSPDGVPYFFYRNESNFPAIVSFDNETQDWSVPHILEMTNALSLSLDFALSGEAYASYIKNRKVIIHQFTKP